MSTRRFETRVGAGGVSHGSGPRQKGEPKFPLFDRRPGSRQGTVRRGLPRPIPIDRLAPAKNDREPFLKPRGSKTLSRPPLTLVVLGRRHVRGNTLQAMETRLNEFAAREGSPRRPYPVPPARCSPDGCRIRRPAPFHGKGASAHRHAPLTRLMGELAIDGSAMDRGERKAASRQDPGGGHPIVRRSVENLRRTAGRDALPSPWCASRP